MQLTKNFTLAEFACHDGSVVPMQYAANVQKLAENLQVLRDYLGKPITIMSGYRSPAYNEKVGGEKHSFHMQALAADIQVPGLTPAEVHAAILKLIAEGKMKDGGLGIYNGWVHTDVRDYVARWDKRDKPAVA